MERLIQDVVYVTFQLSLFIFGAKDATMEGTLTISFNGSKNKGSAQQDAATNVENN